MESYPERIYPVVLGFLSVETTNSPSAGSPSLARQGLGDALRAGREQGLGKGGVPSKEAAGAAGVPGWRGPSRRERKRQAFATGGKKRVESHQQEDGAADRNPKGEWL